MRVCLALAECGRIHPLKATVLDICEKILLATGMADGPDRDLIMRNAMEVILSLLADGPKSSTDEICDPVISSQIDTLSPLEIENTNEGIILDIVRKVAETELYSRTTFRGFLALVEMVSKGNPLPFPIPLQVEDPTIFTNLRKEPMESLICFLFLPCLPYQH